MKSLSEHAKRLSSSWCPKVFVIGSRNADFRMVGAACKQSLRENSINCIASIAVFSICVLFKGDIWSRQNRITSCGLKVTLDDTGILCREDNLLQMHNRLRLHPLKKSEHTARGHFLAWLHRADLISTKYCPAAAQIWVSPSLRLSLLRFCSVRPKGSPCPLAFDLVLRLRNYFRPADDPSLPFYLTECRSYQWAGCMLFKAWEPTSDAQPSAAKLPYLSLMLTSNVCLMDWLANI